jgi:two-component system, LytTR family, response regulator LytT
MLVINHSLQDNTSVRPLYHEEDLFNNQESRPVNGVNVKYFFAKKGKKYVKVFTEEILWIEALDNYVIIQTLKDKFIVHSTLKDMEEKFSVRDFMRVHRSYVVRLDKIDEYDDGYIKVSNKVIAVGKAYKKTLKQCLLLL